MLPYSYFVKHLIFPAQDELFGDDFSTDDIGVPSDTDSKESSSNLESSSRRRTSRSAFSKFSESEEATASPAGPVGTANISRDAGNIEKRGILGRSTILNDNMSGYPVEQDDEVDLGPAPVSAPDPTPTPVEKKGPGIFGRIFKKPGTP